MKEQIRIFGSLFILVSGFVCGGLTVALFIDATWVIETLGLVGFGIYVVWTCVCSVVSLSFDLVGNVKELAN